MSLSHADDETLNNRNRILSGLNLHRFYEVNQVHGNELSEWNSLQDSDGIYTDELLKPLFIRAADCQSAVFYDPELNVLANVHAGWRSLEKGIYSKTIERLNERYGTVREDLLVAIGPSISGPSFEFKEGAPSFMHPFEIGNNYFDLKKAAEHELIKSGIQKSNIEIAPECTFSDAEHFYSYRRDKNMTRQGMLAWLCSK